MLKSVFLHEIKGGSAQFGDWVLWPKPTELVNENTGETIKFKNVEDAYEHAHIDGRPLKEFVEEMKLSDMYGHGTVTIDDSDIMYFKNMFPEDFEDEIENAD